MSLTEESVNKFIIGHCICNEPIYRVGEQIVYTCEQAPCYPQETFEIEEREE